ncbi:MAG: DUF167 domain-containing protein [Candidatus Paceibacterota bacterium]|jgi:uncharacterized protein YggU (UPF0235/DUF167 family)
MYIHVKVTAGAKKESMKKLKADHYAVSVKEPAERNMANKRVALILAAYFTVLAGKIRLVSGHRSPSKIFRVDVD